MEGHPKDGLVGVNNGNGGVHLNPDGTPRAPTEEEKAQTARRLKPHSRSMLNLQNQAKPDRMTPIPAKKARQTKWQFGIRSRNQPAEAMLAIYKALRAMGADWEIPRIRRPGRRSHSHESQGSDGSEENEQWSDGEGDVDQHHTNRRLSIRNPDPNDHRGRTRDRRDGQHNDWGYHVPEDPWVINARYRKSGMYAPGINHPDSRSSSRIDLSSAADSQDLRLRNQNSAHSDDQPQPSQSLDDMNPLKNRFGSSRPIESCYVYLTIQLYQIDADFYLVDFKCAGYEAVAREFIREVRKNPRLDITDVPRSRSVSNAGSRHGLEEGDPGDEHVPSPRTHKEGHWRPLKEGDEPRAGDEVRDREVLSGIGRAQGDKLATSPYPFLDVASALIIQLAEGDG